MKLDKTLEEIKLHNRSLTDDKFKVTREYFELRLQQENKLAKELTTQKQQIEKYKAKLKITKNISAEKIHKYAVKYKKVATVDNITKLAQTTFDDLISEFDYNCVFHYENNKEIILEYIQEVFKLYVYFTEVKNSLKSELKSFNMNISSALLIQLVSEYNIFKRNLEVVAKLDYNIEDFKDILEEQQTLKPIITEFFLTIVTNNSDNYIKQREKENKRLDNIKINDKMKKKINNIKQENKINSKETIVENIVSSTFKSLLEDEDIIKLQERSKENKRRAEERKLRKANMTKEEKQIYKQNKKISQLVSEQMFGNVS